jgi:homopolymeric O-antigen transport system permease protein
LATIGRQVDTNAAEEQPRSAAAAVERSSGVSTERLSPLARAERIVIEPTRGWMPIPVAELWEYRELLLFMVWRDLKVRYRQTVLGVLWVVVQPLILMGIFALLLGRLGGLSKGTPGHVPYTVLVFAGLVPWTLFASSMSATSQSLVNDAHLITKVYFPRLILPISSVGSYLVDFLLATAVLLVLMAGYGIYPGWRIVALPAVAVVAIVSALGVGTWLTALNVRYRDVRYAVPFLVQVWLFASPVAYSSTKIPTAFRALYDLNPIAAAVEGSRWALIGTQWRLGWLPAISVATAFIVLVTGAMYFRRVERTFADEI